MVIGETQILGQMKDAVRTANEAGALGTYLNQLFQKTFSVAKEVRGSTEIGAHSISMAAASVRLAERIFESIGEQKILFIGGNDILHVDTPKRTTTSGTSQDTDGMWRSRKRPVSRSGFRIYLANGHYCPVKVLC
jgi:hypothetical protein